MKDDHSDGMLSHGNSGAERGFSITKQHLELHGNKTNEDILNPLRNVKDYHVVTEFLRSLRRP